MKNNLTSPLPFHDAGAPDHFAAGSALRAFIAGRLGAPACWPNESSRKLVPARVSDDAHSIQRWETEGGKTIPPISERRSAASKGFYTTRPLLTQLI